MNKLDKALKKHPDHNAIIRNLYKQDFTDRKKYFPWMVKQFIAGGEYNDIVDIIQPFDKYGKNLQNPDIYQYDLKELGATLQKYCAGRKIRLNTLPKRFRLVDNKTWLVVRLDDEKIAQKYGYGAKWCTSMRNDSHFVEYTSDGKRLYIVYNKKTKDKYCVLAHHHTYDVFDKHNEDYYGEIIPISKTILNKIAKDKWLPIGYLLYNACTKEEFNSLKRRLRQKFSEHKFNIKDYLLYDRYFSENLIDFLTWCYKQEFLSFKDLKEYDYEIITYDDNQRASLIEDACAGKHNQKLRDFISKLETIYTSKQIEKIEKRIISAKPQLDIIHCLIKNWESTKRIEVLGKTKYNELVLYNLLNKPNEIIKYIDYYHGGSKKRLLDAMPARDLKVYIKKHKLRNLSSTCREKLFKSLHPSKQMKILREEI